MIEANNVEISKGIYWVGANEQNGNLHCNPYLLVDGDEGVLFDPGSVLDFEYVYKNITAIIPKEKIKYVVLHHQDPDLCSSVPLFEKQGCNFKIVTHWRTKTLVKYYGVKSEYYVVNENNFQLVLKSGRKLNFLQTPYLHFPGAIATYDKVSKILFSSDLFGAISKEWSLFAKEDYLEKMKVFHEHYMPSNEVLRPVMEMFLKLDISMIAPQHGSIIKENVKKYICELRELECGTFLIPIRKTLSKASEYRNLCTFVLQRYAALFTKEEVLQVVEDLNIVLDKETMEIKDYNYPGHILWNFIFEKVLQLKGIQWLILIEPFIEKLTREYGISMPDTFEACMKKTYELLEENQQLREINKQLERGILETQDKLTRCPVTGLYNYEFFKSYLSSVLENNTLDDDSNLVLINLDNMAKIRFSYGDTEVDDVLKNTGQIIEDLKTVNSILFRLQGATFALYLPNTSKEIAIKEAEKIRNAIAESEQYIETITVSMGLVCFNEIKTVVNYEKHPLEALYELAMLRVRIARVKGRNLLCYTSEKSEYKENLDRVLIIDTDDISMEVMKTILENNNFQVITANDGEAALRLIENQLPKVIISETMLPKKDGFLIRETLMMQSHTKNIPFIFVSHLKNEDSVKRALSLGVEHYLRKPYMLSELLGIVKLKIKGDTY